MNLSVSAGLTAAPAIVTQKCAMDAMRIKEKFFMYQKEKHVPFTNAA